LGLVFAVWLSFVGFTPSVTYAQSPCAQTLPNDYIVGETRSEVVTITGTTVFRGRIIVRNESTLHFRNTEVEVNGDVLVCDSSTLRVERTVMTVNMPYFLGREFKGYNRSTFEFTNSFFINEQAFANSLILTNSHVRMSFVNRTDLEHRELANRIFAWTTAMIDTSSAAITDTYYDGEVSGFLGNARLDFIRSRGLILWINCFLPTAGGIFTLPSAGQTPINWRLDSTTPDVQGIPYAINIENSRVISSGVLIQMTYGVPNVDVTIRDSSAAMGLIFLNQPEPIALSGLRERMYTELTLPLPSRRVRLERTRVWTWSMYATGSNIRLTDSEIGEVFSESFMQQTALVQLVRSKLTGNGGHYLASNPSRVAVPPTIQIINSDIFSNLTAINGGRITVESSRIFEEGEGTASGGTLLADNGTVVVSNSTRTPGIETRSLGTGAIWQATVDSSIVVRDDGTRVVTFRGDAGIASSMQPFASYALSYAPQANPAARSEIGAFRIPVRNGTLFTWNVPESVEGGNYIVTLSVFNTVGNHVDITRPLRLPDQGGVIPYSTQNNGVEGIKTSGSKSSGEVGSLVVDPDVRGIPVGTALVSFSQENTMITEVAVSESSLTKQARVLVDVDDDADNDIVIANAGDKDSKLLVTLIGSDGEEYDKTGWVVSGFGQTSDSFKKLFPSISGAFQGSLRIESELPVGVVAMKHSGDKNNYPKLATLPVIDQPSNVSSDVAILPYITDGGRTRTEIILVNTSKQTLSGQVQLNTPGGDPAYFTIGSKVNTQFPYRIPPDGVLTLTTAGKEENAQVGYAWITADKDQEAPRSSALVRLVQDEALVWETGYDAPPPTAHARLLFELNEEVKPSIVIANPNDSAATVTFNLRTSDGTAEITRATVTIPPNGLFSRPLNQALDIILRSIQGTLDITSNQPVHVLGLRRTNTDETGFILTALPALDTQQLLTRDRALFPYIIDGEGFRTQLMVMNTGGGLLNGSITFLVPDGSILPLGFKSLF
jgi:hypothetical protein